MAKTIEMRKHTAPVTISPEPGKCSEALPELFEKFEELLPEAEHGDLVPQRMIYLSPVEVELWEERAAICEFDGGYARDLAEGLAMDDILRQRGCNDEFEARILALGGIEMRGAAL